MIYEIINDAISVFLTLLFYSIFLSEKRISSFRRWIVCVLYALSVIVVSVVFNDRFLIKVLCALVLNSIVAVVLFRDSLIKCISIGVLAYAMLLFCDFLFLSILKIVRPDIIVSDLMSYHEVVYFGSLSQLMQFVLVLILRRVIGANKVELTNSRLWLVYLVFPVYSISLMVLLGLGFERGIRFFQGYVLVYIAVSLLFFNVLVYWFINREMKRTILSQKKAMEFAHAKEVIGLYEQISLERDELGKREHEYKNTITTLYKLSQDGHFDDVAKILAAQNTELINNANVLETGNRLITTILNSKYQEARQKGITVRFKLGDLSQFSINERDGIIIFTNILNNAIEAALNSEDKFILIKAVIEEGQLIFSVHNSCSDDNTDMKSKKNDVVSHGYGLTNIREAVTRNNGKCFFENENGVFVSVVILAV